MNIHTGGGEKNSFSYLYLFLFFPLLVLCLGLAYVFSRKHQAKHPPCGFAKSVVRKSHNRRLPKTLHPKRYIGACRNPSSRRNGLVLDTAERGRRGPVRVSLVASTSRLAVQLQTFRAFSGGPHVKDVVRKCTCGSKVDGFFFFFWLFYALVSEVVHSAGSAPHPRRSRWQEMCRPLTFYTTAGFVTDTNAEPDPYGLSATELV